MEWGYARSVLTFRFWDSLPTKDRRPNYRPARVGQKDSFLANVCAGATPRTFWAAESRKSGVAPARFGVFSAVTFAFTASLSPTLQRNCARHRVKNLEKTKLKKVILTLFTCSVWILAARHGATRVIYVFHALFTFPTLVRGLENGKAQKRFLPWHRFEFEGLAQHRSQKTSLSGQ